MQGSFKRLAATQLDYLSATARAMPATSPVVSPAAFVPALASLADPVLAGMKPHLAAWSLVLTHLVHAAHAAARAGHRDTVAEGLARLFAIVTTTALSTQRGLPSHVVAQAARLARNLSPGTRAALLHALVSSEAVACANQWRRLPRVRSPSPPVHTTADTLSSQPRPRAIHTGHHVVVVPPINAVTPAFGPARQTPHVPPTMPRGARRRVLRRRMSSPAAAASSSEAVALPPASHARSVGNTTGRRGSFGGRPAASTLLFPLSIRLRPRGSSTRSSPGGLHPAGGSDSAAGSPSSGDDEDEEEVDGDEEESEGDHDGDRDGGRGDDDVVVVLADRARGGMGQGTLSSRTGGDVDALAEVDEQLRDLTHFVAEAIRDEGHRVGTPRLAMDADGRPSQAPLLSRVSRQRSR